MQESPHTPVRLLQSRVINLYDDGLPAGGCGQTLRGREGSSIGHVHLGSAGRRGTLGSQLLRAQRLVGGKEEMLILREGKATEL